ncbi:IS66 family insertion sequence element accessory protein TnpB, partial [Variovorax sp. J31P216]|nr:IS66 family insertion sequence element accessory protein TnpB [Variovorax sp. J31P216]
ELPMSAAATRDGFIEFQLPPPVAAAVQRPDIRVELKRKGTVVVVTWPASAAAESAAWLREVLR